MEKEITYERVLNQCVKQGTGIQGKLLALDPGETTGWAIFENGKMTSCGQWDTSDISSTYGHLKDILSANVITVVVYESYRVYAWKAKEHTHSELHTPQLIGAIKALLGVENIPYYSQSAQIAKGFVTDDKLKAWGLWIKGARHARDAIRHGIYFTLFTQPKLYKESLK